MDFDLTLSCFLTYSSPNFLPPQFLSTQVYVFLFIFLKIQGSN